MISAGFFVMKKKLILSERKINNFFYRNIYQKKGLM